jgi:Protein of unknown function (DUF4232)
MRDEDLRDQMAAWIRPVQELPVPDLAVIRRRVHRRRVRVAAAAAAAIAVVAGSGLLIRSAVAPSPAITRPASPAITRPASPAPTRPASPAPTHPAVTGPPRPASARCSDSDLRVGWSPSYAGTMPGQVYAIVFLNTGTASCSLDGWPRMAILSPSQLTPVPVGYQSSAAAWAVISPAQIVLRPGTSVAANVLVGTPEDAGDCGRPTWAVTPPQGQASITVAESVPPSPTTGPQYLNQPLVCANSTITVSPVFPGDGPQI